MNPRKEQKKSKMIVALLKKKSRKGLIFTKKTILAEEIEHKKLREALEYYVLNWTDFTHLGLFSIACEAVGGNPDRVLPIQAAILNLSAAFDIHDDIIDKSKFKHGKPTVFGKFGKEIALLLGNAFLVKGFTVLGKSLGELTENKVKDVFITLEKSLFEIGNAHALELNLRRKLDIEPQEYFKILKMKASSIEADMRIGAIVGGGTKSEVEALTKYGRILGILAVLREEFIDIFELEELSQRMRSGCLPIPILYVIQDEKSRERIQKLLAKKRITSKDHSQLLDLIFETKGVRRLKRAMEVLIEEATQLVPDIKLKNSKAILKSLAESVLEDLQ